MIRKFVWVKIGNGRDCNICFDKWNHLGPLCKTIKKDDLSSAGMDPNAKVVDLVDDQGWLWPLE